MISVCGDAHLAVETAIKSYTAAIAQQHPSRGRSAHSIRELLAPLSRQQQLDITAAMGERSPEDLSPWRTAGSYIREPVSLREIQRLTPQFVGSMLNAAHGVCSTACDAVEQRYGTHETVDDMREALEDIEVRGSVTALAAQPHFARSTYARYSVPAHPHALSAQTETSSGQLGERLPSSHQQTRPRRRGFFARLFRRAASPPSELCGRPKADGTPCGQRRPSKIGDTCAADHKRIA